MKYKLALLSFVLILIGSISGHAQCVNQISVTSSVNESSAKGFVEVSIKSDTRFTCVIKSETATNSIVIEEKGGNGNKKIQFSGLELGEMYSIEVKFSNSEDFLCSILTKSILFK